MSLIYADMHNHTTFSDGQLTPSQLIIRLSSLGAKACAITDHDTIDGLDEAKEIAKEKNIAFSPAIEISTYTYREIHILGYGIDYHNENFLNTLAQVKSFRVERNIALFNRLKELGLSVDIDPTAKGIGRVHFAKALVDKGYCVSINDAFDTFLGADKKAYIKAKRLSPLEAVKCIKDCGGVPVLAHPKSYLIDKKLDLLVTGLIGYGLKGIEVHYPTHNETETSNLLNLANRLSLIPTSGSDFHSLIGSHLEQSHFIPKMEERDIKKLLPKF